MIFIEQPKRLSINNSLKCFSCKVNPASHVCRFKWGGLAVQACLCLQCMGLETAPLFEKVMGCCDRPNDSVSDPIEIKTKHLEFSEAS
jgi:hypothetical protein